MNKSSFSENFSTLYKYHWTKSTGHFREVPSAYIVKSLIEIRGDFLGKMNYRFYDNTKRISIPKKDEKLAEFIGIVLGDGNLNAYKKGKKVRTYMVRIAGL